MAKRTDTKIAVLVQVMDEMGFDQDIIARTTGLPQRTVSDIVHWRGCWGSTGDYNELRESYRLHLRKFIKDDSAAVGIMVLRRLEEIAKTADFMTVVRVASAMTDLVLKFDDRR